MSVTSEHAEAGYLGMCPYCDESVWDDAEAVAIQGSRDWAHKACHEETMREIEEMLADSEWGD